MDNNTREIPLGKSGKVAIVDADDYEWLTQWKWNSNYKGYACRTNYLGGGRKNTKLKTLMMHKAIWENHNGTVPDRLYIDHRDGNRLNNKKENLRLATHAENKRNSRVNLNSSTGYKGVTPYIAEPGKFNGHIGFEKRKIMLGVFDTPEDAAYAYNQKALELFGEFAWLNPLPKGFIGKRRRDKQANNTSGEPGVSFSVRQKQWQSRANWGGKRHHLGWFDTFEEAVACRRSAVKEHEANEKSKL